MSALIHAYCSASDILYSQLLLITNLIFNSAFSFHSHLHQEPPLESESMEEDALSSSEAKGRPLEKMFTKKASKKNGLKKKNNVEIIRAYQKLVNYRK